MGSDVWDARPDRNGPASFDVFTAYCKAIGCNADEVAEVRARYGSVRRAAAELLPDPSGFPRAFERYRGSVRPGVATTRTMKDLQTVMACCNGQKVVRHAEILTAHLLRTTAILQPSLRHTSIVSHIASPTEARLLARIHATHAARDQRNADTFAALLQRCDSRVRLFSCAARALDKMQRHYPRLEQEPRWILVRTPQEVEAAGALFTNCLRETRWRDSYASAIANGSCIVMIRPSRTTPLIADIRPALIGEGRVAQLCGIRNEPQPAEAIAEAAAELAALGFHIKPPGGPLHGDPLDLLIAGVGMLEGGRAQRRAALCLRALDGAPLTPADVSLSHDIWGGARRAELARRDA